MRMGRGRQPLLSGEESISRVRLSVRIDVMFTDSSSTPRFFLSNPTDSIIWICDWVLRHRSLTWPAGESKGGEGSNTYDW